MSKDTHTVPFGGTLREYIQEKNRDNQSKSQIKILRKGEVVCLTLFVYQESNSSYMRFYRWMDGWLVH